MLTGLNGERHVVQDVAATVVERHAFDAQRRCGSRRIHGSGNTASGVAGVASAILMDATCGRVHALTRAPGLRQTLDGLEGADEAQREAPGPNAGDGAVVDAPRQHSEHGDGPENGNHRVAAAQKA